MEPGGWPAGPGLDGVVIHQGEVWWAELLDPVGSGPGFRRPVVVVQGDAFNRSRIATVVVVPLTTTMKWGDAPGNVVLAAAASGLPRDSVANVSQVVALDRALLVEQVSKLPKARVDAILRGIDCVLGREA